MRRGLTGCEPAGCKRPNVPSHERKERIVGQLILSCCIALSASALLLTGSSGAMASGSARGSAGAVVKTPLVVAGFDAAVAEAYGYPGVMPQDMVRGNCGYSWYYLAKRTAKTWTFWTGFHSSKGPAVDYSWTTQVWGPARYHVTDKFGGLLGFDSTWQSRYQRFHSIGRHGSYLGRVTSGVVITAEGYVCHPAGPWDRKNF